MRLFPWNKHTIQFPCHSNASVIKLKCLLVGNFTIQGFQTTYTDMHDHKIPRRNALITTYVTSMLMEGQLIKLFSTDRSLLYQTEDKQLQLPQSSFSLFFKHLEKETESYSHIPLPTHIHTFSLSLSTHTHTHKMVETGSALLSPKQPSKQENCWLNPTDTPFKQPLIITILPQ